MSETTIRSNAWSIVIRTYVWSYKEKRWLFRADSDVYDIFPLDLARLEFLKGYLTKESTWAYRLDHATYNGFQNTIKARLVYLFDHAFLANRPFDAYRMMKYVFYVDTNSYN